MLDYSNIIIRPIITEKSSLLEEQDPQKLVFQVALNANKQLVKKAIEFIFNIKPSKVNIINKKATPVYQGTKHPGFSKAMKLAYVTFAKGVKVVVNEEEIKQQEETLKQVAKKPKKGTLTRLAKEVKENSSKKEETAETSKESKTTKKPSTSKKGDKK